MKIAIDTNGYVDFARNDPDAVDRIRSAESIFVPFIVVGELRAGFVSGTRSSENEGSLVRFLNRPRVHVLHADESTTHSYAQLLRQLRRQGTPIPTNDIWIAALVVQHGLQLFARDRHFDHLPQIPRV